MSASRHRTLAQFVHEQAGDAHRATIHYDAHDYTLIHLRGDLDTEELDRLLEDGIDRAREERALVRAEDYPPLGEAMATTEIHESAVLVHFPERHHEGILVSLDREVARRLTGFVGQCLTILNSRRPDALASSGE